MNAQTIYMLTGKPFYLSICTVTCGCLSYLGAGVQYGLYNAGILRVPACIVYAPGGVYKALQRIWCSRLTRRVVSVLVRTPFRKHTLRLVNYTDILPSDSGCIVVSCHTPWKRLMVQWCLENNIAWFISQGLWTDKKRTIQKQGTGFSELREITRHLQQNGRVIIAADVFNGRHDCPVNFLEKKYNASLFPARLAKIANVPMFPIIPVLRHGSISIDHGCRSDPASGIKTETAIMQDIIAFFDGEIKRNPCIWSSFVK